MRPRQVSPPGWTARAPVVQAHRQGGGPALARAPDAPGVRGPRARALAHPLRDQRLAAPVGIRYPIRLIPRRRMPMRWEIPQATDFRFGMENTLYIARRCAGYPRALGPRAR